MGVDREPLLRPELPRGRGEECLGGSTALDLVPGVGQEGGRSLGLDTWIKSLCLVRRVVNTGAAQHRCISLIRDETRDSLRLGARGRGWVNDSLVAPAGVARQPYPSPTYALPPLLRRTDASRTPCA